MEDGGGDCGKDWAPARVVGEGRGRALPSLSAVLPGFSGLGAPLLSPPAAAQLQGHGSGLGTDSAALGVGSKAGPRILGPDSCPAWPTDYESPVFRLRVPEP